MSGCHDTNIKKIHLRKSLLCEHLTPPSIQCKQCIEDHDNNKLRLKNVIQAYNADLRGVEKRVAKLETAISKLKE